MRKIKKKDVRKILISSSSLDLSILRSRSDTTVFEYEEMEDIELNSNVVGETWKIRINSFKGKSIFSLLFNIPHWRTIRGLLYVPEGVDEVILKTANGDVEISGVNLKKMELSSVSGDLSMENSHLSEFHIRSTSGNVKARNTRIDNMSFTSVSGDLSVDYFPKDFGYLKINTVSGDVDIYVEGGEEIILKKRSKFSDVKSRIPVKMVDQIMGSGVRRYVEFSSVSGTLTVESRHDEGKSFAGIEEYKILELLKYGKISRDFAMELLMNLGYLREDAENFLRENECDLNGG
ncbi:MAG: DUF4097 family beta strand repeat protein [Thermotogae bacterium]|nr:DUF4097 family beta strand repeat protein [Thermotogota bacterium]